MDVASEIPNGQFYRKFSHALTLTIFPHPFLKRSLKVSYTSCFIDAAIGTGLQNSEL